MKNFEYIFEKLHIFFLSKNKVFHFRVQLKTETWDIVYLNSTTYINLTFLLQVYPTGSTFKTLWVIWYTFHPHKNSPTSKNTLPDSEITAP